jgi:hypothetical protein
MDVVGRDQLHAVDGEDEVADRDVDAGARERRAQVGVPALVVVDARDLVAAALDTKSAPSSRRWTAAPPGMSPPRTYEWPTAISAPIMSSR